MYTMYWYANWQAQTIAIIIPISDDIVCRIQKVIRIKIKYCDDPGSGPGVQLISAAILHGR